MQHSPNGSRHTFAKNLLKTFAALAVVLLLLIAFLPTILSTGWGKEKLVELVNARISGKAEIKNLSLGWFGPQSIDGFALKDPQGTTVISIDNVKADASLISLLRKPASAGVYDIQNLNALLITDRDGTTNLEKSLVKGCCPAPASNEPMPAIVLKNIQAQLNESTLHVAGETQQDTLVGKFLIDAELKGISTEQLMESHGDWAALLAAHPEAVIKANADIVNFPVALLDQFIVFKFPELAGLITEILGPQLNMSIKQKIASNGIALALQAASSNLAASGEALVSQEITLGRPLDISLNISSSAFAKLLAAADIQPALELTTPTKVHVVINKLQLPLNALQGSLANIDLPSIGLGAAINIQFGTGGLLAQAIGNSADIAIALQPYEEKLRAKLQVQSDHLNIDEFALLIDKQIELQQTAAITLQISPQLIDQFMPEESLVRLQSDANVNLAIQNFMVPLAPLLSSSELSEIMQHMSLKADLTLSPLTFDGLPAIDAATISEFAVNIVAKPFARSHLSVAGVLSQPNANGILSSMLGAQTAIAAKTSFSIFDGSPKIGAFDVQVNSQLARIELSGEITDGKRLRLTAPAMIDYTLTAAGLQTMGIASDNYIFDHKSPMRLTVSSTHIPLNMRDISQLFISGDIKIADFTLTHKSANNVPVASLDDMTAHWAIDGGNKLITLDFSGATRLEQQAAGKLTGALAIENWLNGGVLSFNQATMRISTNIHKLPTAMLSALSGQNELLPLIGNAIDMGIKGKFSLMPHPKGNLELSLHSTHVEGTADLSLDDSIRLGEHNQPAEFKFKLTPQGYTALRRWINPAYAGDFTLTEDTLATLKVTSLYVPLNAEAVHPLYLHAGIDADLLIDRLTGLDKNKQVLSLNKIKGNISSKDLSRQIAFNMDAHGHSGQGIATTWNIVGSLENGLNANGGLNRQDLSLSLDGNVENLPIPLLCHLACKPDLGRQVEAVIGPTLNAKVKAQLQRMNGPVYLDIKGSNGNILLDAQLYEGVMTLRNDLKAQVTITPQLGQYVLQEFIPIINGIQSADQPMRFTVDKQGFALPLRAIDPTTVAIGKATLELGNVKFSNKSQLAKVLSLLTPANAEQIQVWLTPAYFSLNNGIVKLERLDLLLNERYPLATWGSVDMGNDRVNMMIGLSGAAIGKAFGVTGIPKGYMLQVPLRGTMSNASIDKTKAAGRLSALVAQTQGGPQGLVIGTVLDIATGGMSEPKVPSPTTNPLPWSNIMDEQDTVESKSEDKSGKHRSENPIEEITRGAGSLIKKLFK